jgi:hypothetical protein
MFAHRQFDLFAACLLGLIILARPLNADSIAVKPAADTTLFETTPDGNLGKVTTVVAGTTAKGKKSRALLRFDFAGKIPEGSTVTQVQLTLTLVDVPQGGGVGSLFGLQRMLQSWGEGAKTAGTGAPASPGELPGRCVSRLAPPGAFPAHPRRRTTSRRESVSTSVTGGGTYTFASTTNLVADVQFWLDQPTNNFGWIMISHSESTAATARRFASREDSRNAPALTVVFTPPALLRIDRLERVQDDLKLYFTAEAGKSYAVELRDSLGIGGWVNLTNISPAIVATNVIVTDPVANRSQRFYRLELLP